MKLLKILFLILIAFPSVAGEMVIGDVDSLIEPNDDDFRKMQKANEYYDALNELVKKQATVRDAIRESNTGVAPGQADGQPRWSSGNAGAVPRSLRGSPDGDAYVDSKGKLIQEQKRPTASMSVVSGMSGNLSAELVWGDRTLKVRRGDTIIGGGWIVDSVSRDDIVIKNGNRALRIGVLPVFIDTIMGE